MIEYRTIKETGSHEIEIKKSRFICNIARTQTEEEAKDFAEKIKKEHYKATHNCVAYQIGDHNEHQKAMDDGEPSGTAGVPMLEVLKQLDLQYVVAVVTRYFGGIKLGTGGLVRAYSHSVTEAVHAIGVVERQLQTRVMVTVDYALTGRMDYWIENSPYTLLDTSYMVQVTYTLGVPQDSVESCQDELVNLTSGQAVFEEGQTVYVDVPVNID